MVKNLPAKAGYIRDAGSIPRSGGSLEKEMEPIAAFLLGESCGPRSRVGHGPWGRKESDTAEAT